MKYPNAKVKEGTNGWYILLQEGDYPRQKPMYLTLDGKDEEYKNSNFNIDFDTKELAEQALNAFNNMNNKRDYAALKQEGIDKNLCPSEYIYIGKGDKNNPLIKDWGEVEDKVLSKNICLIKSFEEIETTGWEGGMSDRHYCVPKEIWNKKFPNEKKPITLDEIKSQLAEAKKLIGKKVKRINSPRKEDDVAFTVLDVSFNVDFDKFKDVGPRSKEFLKEFGYIIYLHGNFSGQPIFGIFSEKSIKVVEDVKVVLNSSYTATISHDGIRVGCQTFSLDIIDKLVEARKQLA